jgi:4-hydroxybenzoate polyprenyltransferase
VSADSTKVVVTQPQSAVRALWARLGGLLVSLRPHQWVKNTLVFSGLIFSGSLFRTELTGKAVLAFLTFCLASSGIYLFNDLRDLPSDRQHPQKKKRPLAAGQISQPLALSVMIALLLGATSLAQWLSLPFSLLVGLYVLLNAGYSFGFKQVVILDIIIVAMGFVIRAVAGAVVIGVEPSQWLILCTLMLALMIVSGKRRYDVVLAQDNPELRQARREWYSVQFLDLMTAMTGGAAIITYALYTQAAETIARFGTRGIILTVPFVVYGIFRYLFLMHRRESAVDPAKLFLTDRPTLVNALLWALTVCLVLYGPRWWALTGR